MKTTKIDRRTMAGMSTRELNEPLTPPPRRPGQRVTIDVEAIAPSSVQPRRKFDEEDLAALAESLNRVEMLQDIVVRTAQPTSPQPYELICGERRLRAARLAGWREVPARLVDLSDVETLIAIGVENMMRVDLNPIERAEYLRTLRQPPPHGAGMSEEEIATLFKKSRAWVSNTLRLLKLPESFQAKLVTGEWAETQARSLISYTTEPAVVAAIEADLEANPELWKTREQLEERAEFIASHFRSLNQASDGEEPLERHIGPVRKPRVSTETPAAEEAEDATSAENGAGAANAEASSNVVELLRPFEGDRQQLEAIRQHVELLLSRC